MKRNRRRLSLFFLSLWVLFSPFVLRSDTFASEEKEALIKWEGKVVLSENFVVREVEKLVVEPGTEIVVSPDKNIIIRILGSIEVRGEKDRPVKFRPEGEIAPGKWNGIRIANPRENILKNCTIEGAASGISLTESSLSIEASTIQLCNSAVKVFQRSVARVKDCLFSNNIMGIQVSLSGKIEIMGSRFESNREIGIVIENGATGSVKRSEFSNGKIGLFGFTKSPVVTEESNFHSLEQGVVFRQVGRNSALRYCTFEKNTTGLQSVQFSFERISDSHFKNNRTAIDVREFSSPHITHCEFHNNEVGINLFRKSNSLVDFNVFRNNRTAMILNFSCYPVIHDNNLERNEIHVKLGKFQSGYWENQVGSKNIMGMEASKRGSRNISALGEGRKFPVTIDAKGNFWGSNLGDVESKELNLKEIWDGKDFGPVTYEGFGDETYRVDIVDISGWRKVPVDNAGVREKGKQ